MADDLQPIQRHDICNKHDTRDKGKQIHRETVWCNDSYIIKGPSKIIDVIIYRWPDLN